MVLASTLFISWRLFELVITVPIVGLLGYFVSQYQKANALTPDFILVLFIVSCIALAWIFFTLISWFRARHDGLFVAFIDFCIMAAFIAGVVVMRRIAGANCSDVNAGITTSGSYFNYSVNRWCAMQKAAFALGIIDIILFFITTLLALWVHRHHRNDDRVVVKRTYRNSSHGSRHGHRRSSSRGSRGHYDSRPRSSGRSHHSTSRRQYYV